MSSKDTVPLKVTFRRLAASDRVKIRANVFSTEGDEPVWLNKWNMVEKGRDTIITSNQFTNKLVHVDRKKAVPKMTVAESKESNEPGLNLKVIVDIDTPGDEVNWTLAIPLPAGGVGPSWAEDDPGHSDSDSGSVICALCALCDADSDGDGDGDDDDGPPVPQLLKNRVGTNYCAKPPSISKATLATRGAAEGVRTRKVEFVRRSGVELPVEVMLKDA